jgi:hypothetical protein
MLADRLCAVIHVARLHYIGNDNLHLHSSDALFGGSGNAAHHAGEPCALCCAKLSEPGSGFVGIERVKPRV